MGLSARFQFYFPGYGEGGMSGDLENTAMPVALYQRMPQLPTMNTNGQTIPRIWLPEAIVDGKAEATAGRQVDRSTSSRSSPIRRRAIRR